MTKLHRLILVISYLVLGAELYLAIYFHSAIIEWVSHNLWLVIIPFIKAIFKRIAALKLLALFKALFVLLWHFSKLLLLKLFKTLGIRYGIFFSQYRWVWIRRGKVLFLRRGKQFFRALGKFWTTYLTRQKWVILLAFFPIGLILFLLGLSFNLTRKTMVQKTQELAVFQAATSASTRSRGIRKWISKLDELALKKIQSVTRKNTPK